LADSAPRAGILSQYDGPTNRGSEDVCVIGVDIQPGHSPSSAQAAKYSVVVLRNNEVKQELRDATLGKIIRIAWECRKAIVAVDNIYELAPDKKSLLKLFEMLPESTEIVQVTAGVEGFRSLEEIKRSLGLDDLNTSDPLSSARIIAYAASRGVGLKIGRRVTKTKIVVTRGRSVSHGGMSLNRYLRSIRAGILSVTKDIKKVLDEKGLDYDLYIRRSKGGLERSVFIVYAPRDELYGLVRPIKSKGVKVVIKPLADVFVGEEDKETPIRPVIVGIDPGMTTGLAIIDLDGRVLHASSYRGIDRSAIVNIISEYGIPVVVTSDVNSPPDLVEKIAAQTGSVLISPPRDLEASEKQRLLEKAVSLNKDLELKDSHVKDAVAAAYKALNMISDKLLVVRRYARHYRFKNSLPYILRDILKGRPVNEVIEKYIEIELKKSSAPAKPVALIERQGAQEPSDTLALKQRLVELEALVKSLENKLAEKEEALRDLELELKLLRSKKWDEECERRIYMLTNEIGELRKSVEDKERKINELAETLNRLSKALKEVSEGNLLVVPRFRKLPDALKVTPPQPVVFVDEVGVLDEETLKYLKSNKIVVLTRKKGISYTPAAIIEYNPVVEFNDVVIVEKRVINEGQKLWSDIEKQEREDELNRVLKLIEEYQAERMKKLGVKRFDRSI
jgi:predicted RNase H-like nuclease (RuvC/YqgF family)